MAEDVRADMARDYAAVFGTSPGRRVLLDLAAAAGMTTSMVDTPALEPLALAAEAGKRRIVLRIMSFLETSEAEIAALAYRAREEARAGVPRTAVSDSSEFEPTIDQEGDR